MDGPDRFIDVPFDTAMFAAVLLAPAADDVMTSARTRDFALNASSGQVMIAYHWACHFYLRDCPFNIWHGD